MRYRRPRKGDGFASWVQELKGKSGVYLIRSAGELVYIGESHSGRLYKTLTRHFFDWGRDDDWFSGMFGSADPGHTYDPNACTVAVELTSDDRATARQYELIQELNPRDNQVDGDGDYGSSSSDDSDFFDW